MLCVHPVTSLQYSDLPLSKPQWGSGNTPQGTMLPLFKKWLCHDKAEIPSLTCKSPAHPPSSAGSSQANLPQVSAPYSPRYNGLLTSSSLPFPSSSQWPCLLCCLLFLCIINPGLGSNVPSPAMPLLATTPSSRQDELPHQCFSQHCSLLCSVCLSYHLTFIRVICSLCLSLPTLETL